MSIKQLNINIKKEGSFYIATIKESPFPINFQALTMEKLLDNLKNTLNIFDLTNIT